MSVHDVDMAVTNFPLISSVEEARGCTSFTLSVQRFQTQTGGHSVFVRMCVVMRRKLLFYYWKNRKFHNLRRDIPMLDTARSLAWGEKSLCLGTRNEYFFYQVCTVYGSPVYLFLGSHSFEVNHLRLFSGRRLEVISVIKGINILYSTISWMGGEEGFVSHGQESGSQGHLAPRRKVCAG